MTDVQTFDLAIIGAGPGGYVAAIRASQLGLNTAVIEGEHLGGVCLNWGCIPTKALLRASEINHLLHSLDEYGFAADNVRFDVGRVIARSRKVAAQLAGGVKHLLKKNKVTVIDGWAKLQGGGKIAVSRDGQPVAQVAAKHIIVATGARARNLPGLEVDGKIVWSARHAMVPEKLPANLLVIGSGAIGIEFASFYRNLGCAVTVVEIMDRILPVEDEEISALARKSFEKQGMTILTGAKVAKLEIADDSAMATIEAGGKSTQSRFDRVILAVGITGNVENLGLEATKAKVERGQIKIDAFCRTDEPGLYAIGDVAGPPALAHKASHEGVLCVEAIVGIKGLHPIDPTKIPGCTYCRPQIASVGLTEAKARAAGHEIRIGRFPYIGNGKAIAMGEAEGLVKTIYDKITGELLGAHMIGAEVTELIQGFTIARTAELTEADLMHTVFPHPTLSEMMHESVLDAYGQVIHF